MGQSSENSDRLASWHLLSFGWIDLAPTRAGTAVRMPYRKPHAVIAVDTLVLAAARANPNRAKFTRPLKRSAAYRDRKESKMFVT
jgi:hypothetical protein